MAASTSSSQTNRYQQPHDVFLNFRGDDTRYCFICYLNECLRKKGINTFIDEELTRGNGLSGLLETIERSKMSIVVFSENYANSPWCLEELAKIMECKKNSKQMVVPVFYKVPVSNVSDLTGKFGAPFERPEEYFHGYEHRIPVWKEAIKAASDIAGYVLPEKSPENEFVAKIAKETFKLIFPGSRVFVNFRRIQLSNFVSHLVNAFEIHKINFFLDDKMSDTGNIFQKIEESRIALVIFSTMYPQSSWLMDELARIKELEDQGKLQVIPIFYKVEPANVLHLEGEFGDTFWKLARTSSGSQIKKWKEAIEAVSSRLGFEFRDMSSESIFIKKIVMELQKVMATLELEEGEDHYELPDFQRSGIRQF